MRQKKIVLFICFLLITLFSCKKEKQAGNCLIQNFELKGEVVESIDQLFGNKGKYTTLETTDESLVGKIGKIVKRGGFFFILSEEKEILQFDEDGKFVSSLNKRGAGPGEYTMITDFSVSINSNKELEIWISDYSTIKKYQHKNNSWEQFASINYSYVINKFHIINENSILLLSGQNENCLTLTDGEGKEISSYLKSEIPFLTFKPVQFITFQDELIFQKGMSNGAVRFSLTDNTYKENKIICEDRFLSSNRLLDLFSEYEYDYLRHMSEYSYIRTLRQIEGQTLIDFYTNEKRHVSIYTIDIGWKTFSYNLKDILHNSDLQYLSTIGVGDGTTSFIMFKNNENENENPIIVEY